MAVKLRFPKDEITDVIRARSKVFWTVGLFTAFINLLMLVPSIYMLQVYDRVLPSSNEMTLLMLTLITLGMFAIMGGLEYIRSMVVIRIGSQFDMCLNQRVYTASYESNLKSGSTDAGQMLNDLATIRQFLTGNALFAFFDAPWFPVYLCVIFLFSPYLGLLALVGAIILISLAILNQWLSQAPLAEASNLSLRSANLASTNLRNAEVIEALGMLPALRHRWFGLHERFLNFQHIASERSASITALTKTVRMALQSLILGLGGWLALGGHITPGMMIAGSILMGRSLSPIEQLIQAWKSWSAARLSWQRLDKLLQAQPERKSGMSLPAPKGTLSLDKISAMPPGKTQVMQAPENRAVPNNQYVLQDISFALNSGDVLGVIGPSASGKSTLARLLVGIWPTQEGVVRLDDADIYQWNKDELGAFIGYLPQDIELFGGSIAENIARFNDIEPEKVIEAAKKAGVHELVLNLEQGYDTIIGAGGMGLSGGQKQRIGLARALYGNPSLVVLDEPNSNLDDMGEKALSHAIVQLREQGKTVVVITHRPSLLSQTNKILLLVQGKMKMFGPSQQVMAALSQSSAQQSSTQQFSTQQQSKAVERAS
ncbi:Alkaline protease secretion ATP-binding protein aprD [Xenorhabdus nematophila ATCC 19061]|uniref:Alkaline protease secretion ATP-binding protein aprD n=1 Tax=Xenorhabdus nematophila (strain ATCC 19061 / DSM 3370 / CCUG 14189 / LMG 1036 / NCIMB 9965 / AN6) TaxID=406817 RepID=D3VCL3_XENNA|nr:type I secretion system permease/ATPase [Xenorhabdus nematophila]CBJ92048.1 Alkaline protease secretion ATP-binding protein aprD [Xenorhabdus nematophila ATCC 19061]CEE90768.1 Alkaline protease secretion ATP-binding protein aprD [Xenorhabdus nematophila str. Anatoliense]CEE92868.1 Alkaline protease secretion ATP-binding protein aprD [Xenorhabdus nematophila str. Anatoliense]CEK24863.1 Alkaline protease secretion ATP-binding protein aprD [Xenorhabdus nematophila AN6/1]